MAVYTDGEEDRPTKEPSEAQNETRTNRVRSDDGSDDDEESEEDDEDME